MKMINRISSVLVAFFILTAGPLQAKDDGELKARMQIAEVLVKSEDSGKMQNQILGMMGQQFGGMLASKNPGKEKEVKEVMTETFAAMSNRKNEVNDEIAKLYANNFTLDELRQMIAFKQSALGKKMDMTMPKIVRQSMMFGQQWGQKVGQEVMTRLRQNAQSRGLKL